MVEAYFRLASRGCHGILYGDRSLGQELEDTVSFFIASSGRREAIIVLLSQQGCKKDTCCYVYQASEDVVSGG